MLLRRLGWSVWAGVAMLGIAAAAGVWNWRTGRALEAMKQEVSAEQGQAQSLSQEVAHLKTVAAAAGTRLPTLPSSLNVATFLRGEVAVARRADVRLMGLTLTPKTDPTADAAVAQDFAAVGGASALHAYPVSVTVSGTEAAVLAFVRDLPDQFGLVTITQVQFLTATPAHASAVVDYNVYTLAP